MIPTVKESFAGNVVLRRRDIGNTIQIISLNWRSVTKVTY